MRRLLLLLGLVLAVLGGCTPSDVSSQTLNGSGEAGSRTESASGVHELALAAPGTLVIEVGRATDLRIEGDDNLVGRLVVEQDGDRLEIRTPRGVSFRPERPLRYRIGVERLDGVHLAGSGRIEAADVETGELSVDVAGAGDVVIGGIRAREVEVSIAGSGDAVLDGAASEVEVSIAGSGNADLGSLAADEVAVSVAGSGDATVRAAEALSASIVGSGDVRYYGRPTIDRSVMGSGDVMPAE